MKSRMSNWLWKISSKASLCCGETITTMCCRREGGGGGGEVEVVAVAVEVVAVAVVEAVGVPLSYIRWWSSR